jgi:ribosome-binding protein aMBF1 (putative translation factor)
LPLGAQTTSHGYNADENRTSVTDSITETYTIHEYDQFDQLTNCTKVLTSATYGYNTAHLQKGTPRRTERMTERRTWSELRETRLSEPEAQQAYETAKRAVQIGDEVRRLRMERGLSQNELAKRVGLSQSVVARLEAGGVEPRLSTLDRVARALDVELDVRFQAKDHTLSGSAR